MSRLICYLARFIPMYFITLPQVIICITHFYLIIFKVKIFYLSKVFISPPHLTQFGNIDGDCSCTVPLAFPADSSLQHS